MGNKVWCGVCVVRALQALNRYKNVSFYPLHSIPMVCLRCHASLLKLIDYNVMNIFACRPHFLNGLTGEKLVSGIVALGIYIKS